MVVSALSCQLWVHQRSSWRERQAGSPRRLRSAEVMMPLSIRIRTATSSDSRTSAAARPRSAILRLSTLMCSATRAEQVAVLGVGVEPLKLVVGAGDLEGAPGDL